jgi:beta-glucanase (GH16 family)
MSSHLINFKSIAIFTSLLLKSVISFSLELVITQASDKSVTVISSKYSAIIDPDGSLTELKIEGLQFLTQKFNPQGVTTINVINKNIVDIRSGDSNIEYIFNEGNIKISTAGFEFMFHSGDVITKFVHTNGQVVDPGRIIDDCKAAILKNNRVVKFSIPFSASRHQNNYVIRPYGYNDNSIKNSSFKNLWGIFEFTLTLADLKDVSLNLSELQLIPIGTGRGKLTADRDRGNGYSNNFLNPDEILFKSFQTNKSNKSISVSYQMNVMSHYICGKELFNQSQEVDIAPFETKTLKWRLPALEPGFYYLSLSAWKDGGNEILAETKFTFMVDLADYTHQLTLPSDFDKFWEQKMTAMRALPFDTKLSIDEIKSTSVTIWYDMEFTGNCGKRFKTVLQVPRKPGKYIADFFPDNKANENDRISIGFPLSQVENATYQRWNNKDDNNMLDVILLAVRLTDYLRSRQDVQGIYLEGGSRLGPIQFINATLDSGKIIGVRITVPTSAGMGWTDEPYYAWGSAWGACGDYDPCDLEARYNFANMSAYFDPVNHAPNIKVPFIVSYGIDDCLSRPEGIEVMYKLAKSSWKGISRDVGGHQDSPEFIKLEQEFENYLGVNGSDTLVIRKNSNQEELFTIQKTGVTTGSKEDYELGTIFSSSTTGSISAVKVFGAKDEIGDHTVRIWNYVDKTLEGGPFNINFKGWGDKWFIFRLPKPVRVEGGIEYVVTVSTGQDSGKYYAQLKDDFMKEGNNGGHLSWPAKAGVAGLVGQCPENRVADNYLRDVVFIPDGSQNHIDLSKWQLTFRDEFDSTELNRDKWETCYASPSLTHGEDVRNHNNCEQQYYTDNAWSLDKGILKLIASKDSTHGKPYSSGMISSHKFFSQEFGYFEIRCKLPGGKGFWPAFWLLPVSHKNKVPKYFWPPEIDALEAFGDYPTQIFQTTHIARNYSDGGGVPLRSVGIFYDAADDLTVGFHNYGVVWNKQEIIWYLDGVETFRTNDHVPFGQPMFIVANLAVGCIAGNPSSESVFPNSFDIDYIRAYKPVF